MMMLPFLLGGATLVLAILVYGAWLGSLPKSVCPQCGEATVPISSRLTSALDRWVRRRWCSACAWTGWGRNGPMLSRERGPVADGSGFRWGEDRLPVDLGFVWRADERARRAANHPSGFRWRGTDPDQPARARAVTR
jgi:hypothetical protein